MKKLFCIIAVIAFAYLPNFSASAQERMEFGYNTNSIRPIKNDNQFFRKTLWYIIDLREKQNQPLNARGFEITRLLIDAVQSGLLRPFTDDRLNERLSLEEFNNRLTISTSAPTEEELLFGGQDDPWGEETESVAPAAPAYYLPGKDLYLLELKEDIIFDKTRSRMYRDIQSITMILPAERTSIGVDNPSQLFLSKKSLKMCSEITRVPFGSTTKIRGSTAIWRKPLNCACFAGTSTNTPTAMMKPSPIYHRGTRNLRYMLPYAQNTD
jgi:hypothetical protein